MAPNPVVRVHADEGFYRARGEPEESLEGMLREVAVRTGPDTRDLPIHLETPEGTFAVYATGATVDQLRGLCDRPVRVRGKRIDQRAEGLGVEVWPATVTPLPGA